MRDETCPKCGAESTIVVNWMSEEPTFEFACGTEQTPFGLVRGNECYENELAVLKAVVREMEGRLRDNHALLFTGEFVGEISLLDERTVEILNRPEVLEIMEEGK